jgi:hypothetical protein
MRESSGRESKVGVGLRIAHLLDGALDADDALELDPVELQRGERMDRQLAALPALVVGEPDDAALVESLDEDDARRRPAFGAHGRQRHRIRLRQLRRDRLLQPRTELLHRVGGGRRLVELGPLIALAQRSDVGHRGSIETLTGARFAEGLAQGPCP